MLNWIKSLLGIKVIDVNCMDCAFKDLSVGSLPCKDCFTGITHKHFTYFNWEGLDV